MKTLSDKPELLTGKGWFSSRISIVLLALFRVTIHLLVINNLEYNRDELLYFSLGQHPDFGFATVPPMIGWLAWLMQNTFGFSLFAVRILPALVSGAMVFLVAALARELGGKSYSEILASIGFMISGFGLRSFGLFMPVFLDVFFWTLIFYLVCRYINNQEGPAVYLIGIFAGLSLLNKYLIALLLFWLLVSVLFTPYSKIFRDKRFWYGLAGGFILFLPNICWQLGKGIPVINHMAELNRTQLVHVDRIAFLTDQLIMPSWASALTISGLIYLLINKSGKKFRVLIFVSLLIILTLFLLRGKGYYTIGVFPFLIAAGAVSYEESLKTLKAKIIFPVLLVLLTLPSLPLGMPVFNEEGLVSYFKTIGTKFGIEIGRKFEDGSLHSLPQDYADMIGWEELTEITAKAYSMIDDKRASFIYGENYGHASAIMVIGKKFGLPEPVSFNESFMYWFPKKFDPDITSFIYINHRLGEDVQNLFNKITLVGRISDPNSREYGTAVYLCQDPKSSFNEFWSQRISMLPGQSPRK